MGGHCWVPMDPWGFPWKSHRKATNRKRSIGIRWHPFQVQKTFSLLDRQKVFWGNFLMFFCRFKFVVTVLLSQFFWWCKLMHIVIIFHIYRIFINMFQTLLVSFCFQRGLPLSWPTGCVLPSPLCSNSTEIGRCGEFDAQQSASWFQYLNLEHVKWRMWADGDDIYIYTSLLFVYIIYTYMYDRIHVLYIIYICIYDYEICQNSPIVNYVEVVHVCFFKPRSPWARGFNLWFIGKRTIWLVTFPMSTYIFRFSWLSRAFTRPTGRFDSNLMSIWPAEIQKHAPAHLLRFYMWSPLIFLGPVILLWRRCAFNTVFVEIPASVARLSGEVFSKRAPNLKHRTTWITWTTYKFLETHHKLRFFSASCWV